MRAVVASLMVWSVGALASPDGGVTQLPPVVVPLRDEPVASSPTQRDPGAVITVIETVNRPGQAKDAAELVAATPGAVLQDQGGAGQRKTVSLRGVSPNGVLVLLDGVPLNGPGNAVDLSRLPVAMLERVEVLRGAGSRYGPGAMGGVVNLISRAPDGKRLFAEVAHGSFWTTTASLGGSTEVLGGEGLVLLHGLRSDGDFSYRWDDKPALAGNDWPLEVRRNNQALLGGGLARFRRALGSGQLDVLAEGFTESRGLAGPVQNPSTDASQVSGRGTLSARVRLPFENGGALDVLAYGRADATTLKGSPFGVDGVAQLETSFGAEAVYTQRAFGWHRFTGLVSAGGDFLREPTRVNPSWGRVSAMAGDELSLLSGRLLVDGTARVDVAGRFVVVSPKLTATVLLPKGFELRASGGQASRPPGFQELYVMQGTLLPNPDLLPERTLQADVSAAFRHERATVQVTGFYGLAENLIAYEYYPPVLAKPYNFAAAQLAGVEVEGALQVGRVFEAQASYTYLSTQNMKDDPRYYLKSLPYRPRHRVTGRVVGGVDWLRGHAEVLVQSEQFINRTESVALAPRAFVNVGIASTPWKNPRVTVAFDVKNVFDVQSQDRDGYPLPPRAAYLSVAVAWDAGKE